MLTAGTWDCQTFRNAKQIPYVRSYQSVAVTAREDEVYLDKQINMMLCVFLCFRMVAKLLRLLSVLCAFLVTLLVLWYSRPEILHPAGEGSLTAVRQKTPELFERFNN
jgi:hypothetical protein